MVCKQCGRELDNKDMNCTFCNADSHLIGNEIAAAESLVYETDQGFAKADTPYEAPFVVDSGMSSEQSYPRRPEKDSSSKSSHRYFTKDKRESKQEHADQQETEKKHKVSRRKEKKLVAQRQQRLYEELRSRLQEEKQESLSRYMYEGLNQDLEETQDEQKKKGIDKSFIFSVLGISLGLLLAVGLLFFLGRENEGSDYEFMAKDAIEVYTNPTEGKTYIFNAFGDLLYKLEGYQYVSYTPDHTAAILYNWNTRYCYYVNAYRMKEFTSTIDNFALSEDGNYVVYSISGGTNKFYLMLYDVAKDKEIMIDNQEKHFGILYILSGGKKISYISYRLSETGAIENLEAYLIQNGGQPELLGENMFVFAISSDIQHIYYGQFIDGMMGAVYVRSNGEEQKLSEGLSSAIYMNKDSSEILIENNGSFYLRSQDGESKKIVDQQINNIIVPDRTLVNQKSNSIIRFGFRSFGEKLLLCNDNSIKYLDNNYNVTDIAVTGDVTNIILTEDNEKLFFLDPEERLIKVSDLGGEETLEVMANDVSDFKVTKDISQIYFLRGQNLYFLDKKNEERLISENVRSLCMNYNRDTVFFLKDYTGGKGTLYYSQNGLSAVPVEGGMNVTGVKEWNFGVIYQKFINNSSAMFYNREGKDFVFIMDGLNLLDDGIHE